MSPRRIPRYLRRVSHTALTVTDRMFNTPLGRLGAYVLAIAVAVAGFLSVQDQQREACQAGNRFRSVDLPAAFARHDRDLGEALGADPAEIEAFVEESGANLRDELPLRDC